MLVTGPGTEAVAFFDQRLSGVECTLQHLQVGVISSVPWAVPAVARHGSGTEIFLAVEPKILSPARLNRHGEYLSTATTAQEASAQRCIVLS